MTSQTKDALSANTFATDRERTDIILIVKPSQTSTAIKGTTIKFVKSAIKDTF
jgi:hypothetical protein